MNKQRNGKASQKLPTVVGAFALMHAENKRLGIEPAQVEESPGRLQHSPLPWRNDDFSIYSERTAKVVLDNAHASPEDRKLIVASVNNAAKLAEALRDIKANLTGRDNFAERVESSLRYANEALAAWEAGQ